jgi:hypothetical protein
LVDEAQKKLLAGILTAQSPMATIMMLMAAVAIMFAGSVPVVVFFSHHGVTGVGLIAAVAALTGLSIYTGLLFCARPTALLVHRHVPDLTPTDQRITAADLRRASEKAIWLPGQLIFALSQAILSVSFFIQAYHRFHGHLVSAPDNIAAFSALFGGCGFAFASVCMLIPALKSIMRGQNEADPTVKNWRLPAFSLAAAIFALAMTVIAGQYH